MAASIPGANAYSVPASAGTSGEAARRAWFIAACRAARNRANSAGGMRCVSVIECPGRWGGWRVPVVAPAAPPAPPPSAVSVRAAAAAAAALAAAAEDADIRVCAASVVPTWDYLAEPPPNPHSGENTSLHELDSSPTFATPSTGLPQRLLRGALQLSIFTANSHKTTT